MQRYFISNEQLNPTTITLNDEMAHHILRVMRMRQNDQVTCVDEDGNVYLCALNNDHLDIVERLDENHELDVSVRLIYGLPKLDKFELVLQKCTELGIKEIVPFLSKRSLIKSDPQRFEKKRVRYEKIIQEAQEQSMRTGHVKLYDPMDLKQVLALNTDLGLVAYEEKSREEEASMLASTLKNLKPGMTITIVVGPEGGFEQSEVDAFVNAGYGACSLGKRILRSETAPIYMMSVISYARELNL